MNAIERKNSAYSRPMLASSALEQDPHHSPLPCAPGDDDALRGLVFEGKSMSTAINSDGGYLVDAQTSDTIKSSLRGASSLRAIANVVTVEATSYDVLVDHTDMGAGWSDETTATAKRIHLRLIAFRSRFTNFLRCKGLSAFVGRQRL